MKRFLGLLLAINIGVFAAGMAMQYWPQKERAALVFNAEKIRLLESSNLPAAPGAVANMASKNEVSEVDPASGIEPEASGELGEPREPGALPVDAAESGSGVLPEFTVEGTVAKPVIAEVTPGCLNWRSLDAEDLSAIQTYLKRLGLSASAYDIVLSKKLGWWVFMPPVQSAADLQVNIEEVRSLGVTDFAPVRGGSMKNAISLGAFANLAQAQKHASELSRKGLSVVRYGPRPDTGVARLVLLKRLPDGTLQNLESGWPKGLKPSRCEMP
jgi:hypothetical protein